MADSKSPCVHLGVEQTAGMSCFSSLYQQCCAVEAGEAKSMVAGKGLCRRKKPLD